MSDLSPRPGDPQSSTGPSRTPETPAPLECFHPLVRRWFLERYGAPTEVQHRAWPVVAAGRHVLAVAPTGSGKTLCAFLWAIDRLATGAWEGGATRVLYVSPLKALNNDIRRNLGLPLEELRRRFEREGLPFPDLRALTRSGDTPERERRQMLKSPPGILITTPESLNLLLSSPRARETLTGLRTVILDEIHAVVSTKRGTHLMSAVERLVQLSGEFQRIALSATVSPPQRVAAFVGGFQLERSGGQARYRARAVEVIRGLGSKPLEVAVRFPAAGPSQASRPGQLPTRDREDPFWDTFTGECLERIRANRSTLIFTNTRRHAEKVARLVNERAGESLAYAHHGSLSREIRTVVEQKLKAGELSAVVATSSLELGIDIGELDEVLLLQTPFSVASALQRIGRAGHGVGEQSRGRLYATHGRDLLNAAIMACLVRRQAIEPARPIDNPLDVLAQLILSMTGIEDWNIDELFDTVRTISSYRNLSRRHFDLVLDMLAGRYAESRIRELEPRVLLDRTGNSVRGRAAALPLVYRAGGTIPDRGYYELRVSPGGAKIGELDEEFVWERRAGDTFNLGTQNWRITRIDERTVEVAPWSGPAATTPFWRAEKGAREFPFCDAVARFLERAAGRVEAAGFAAWLESELSLEAVPAEALAGFLRRQKRATGTELPHRHHLMIEHVGGPHAQEGFHRVVLHTLWGGRVNEPLALAFAAAWERSGGGLEVFADDDCLMLVAPEELDVRELLSLVVREAGTGAAQLEELLRLRLEQGGYFGARFRENAGRALLLPRSDFRRRVPLWLVRRRSKALLNAVRRYPQFPLLLETWRTCLRDDFDLDTLKQLLAELGRGEIAVSEAHTAGPSPFAENLGWIQVNQHMYESDALGSGDRSHVSGGLLREIVYSPHLRPRIDRSLALGLEKKLKRIEAGYSPADPQELWDWVQERLFVPLEEWGELLEAVRRDHGLEAEMLSPLVHERLLCCRLPGAQRWGVCAVEVLPRLLRALRERQGRTVGDPGSRISRPLEGAGPASAAPDTLETAPLSAILWGDTETGVDPAGVRRVASRGIGPASGELPPSVPPPRSDPGDDPAADAPTWGPAALLGEWLRFYGPLPPRVPAELFGISEAAMESTLESLVESGLAVYDQLSAAAVEPEICDAENLETLLRLTRWSFRPALRTRPLEELPLFLALRQGVTVSGSDGGAAAAGSTASSPREHSQESRRTELQTHLEKLFGYPAPAALWEEEILPARGAPYSGLELQDLLRETDLIWFGCGPERLAFCLARELELFVEPRGPEQSPDGERTVSSAPPPGRSFGTWELAEQLGSAGKETLGEIWRRVWAGELSAEGFAVLRQGLSGRFRGALPSASGVPIVPGRRAGRRPRGSFERWRANRPLETRWFALEAPAAMDPVEEQELKRERVRQLLDRYGILFRELLERELPLLRWARVFRTLRIMELSGEVLGGYFFESIQGPQFLAADALALLERSSSEQPVFWLNAADPASPCGLRLELPNLPARLPSHHLVFRGHHLVLVSRSRARDLRFFVAPEDPGIGICLGFLNALTRREWRPWNSVRVERINAVPARESPYKPALLSFGFVEEFRGLMLRAGV